MWVLLMEALRRTGGWSLLLSVLPFTVYPLFAESGWLGPLRGNQSTLDQAIAYHVLSNESLLGIPIQAFAETVIGFLVFGTALMMTGAGKFFINLAFALCGTFRGGAAKVGIFASGLLGMMSGSVVSNVLTAGTMTIPTMKRTGFSPSYAGAIEACASTGAVLAPPVMGATAFVIAQFLNISYAEVALSPPSSRRRSTTWRCSRRSTPTPPATTSRACRAPSCPAPWTTIKEGWYYLLVIALLIVMLLHFKRESHAPFYATALLLVLNQLFSKDKRWTFKTIVDFLELNGRTFVELVGILAGCGLLIGAFSMTGRGVEPRQRPAAHRRRQRAAAARHVRHHQPGAGARAHHHRLLHLPRHPGGAGAGEARPQQDGRAHVHLLLGHAVGDHAAGCHRLVRGGWHRRRAAHAHGLGEHVGRQHHLLRAVLLRAEPDAGAAGAEPLPGGPRRTPR